MGSHMRLSTTLRHLDQVGLLPLSMPSPTYAHAMRSADRAIQIGRAAAIYCYRLVVNRDHSTRLLIGRRPALQQFDPKPPQVHYAHTQTPPGDEGMLPLTRATPPASIHRN
jgi:hypothetical protein